MAGTTGTPPVRPLPTAQETTAWEQDKANLAVLLGQEVFYGTGSTEPQKEGDCYWRLRMEALGRMAKYEETYLAPVSREPRAQSSRTDGMDSVMSDRHTDYAVSPLHQPQLLPSTQTLGTVLPDVAPSTGDAHVVQRPLPPQQPFLIRPRKVMSSINYLKGRYRELRRQYKELCQRFEQLLRENERLRAQLATGNIAPATTTAATAYDCADGVDADGKRFYIIKGVRYDEDNNDFA
ncbi:hypothetical protein FB567DRAFT_535709 [Paraphoma chrysanthemicola]|uniref:Uncharacterized protein n=1 Tax=Paraphoma chrysanthemicola TaxID=798071 RepID=A0A8K0QWY6_9PLEO|nr:hypothetical protein FB567DRAFT_535709 [Paraphoma chrysanthemicola]